MSKLLLIEDDPEIREPLVASLRRSGFVVDAAVDGDEGLFLARNYAYDLLIVDWNLPGLQGIDVLKQLRKSGHQSRILMLTAHTDVGDKVDAFTSGADDYLCKPFDTAELMVRLHALLRRPQTPSSDVLTGKDIELDIQKHKVTCAGNTIKLHALELALLEFFMRHPGQVCTAERLLDNCWKSMSDTTEGAVRYHITGLRKKIDHSGIPGSYIETIHGAGYRFVSDGTGKKPRRGSDG